MPRSPKIVCDLALPGLVPPKDEQDGTTLRFPALETLLARADRAPLSDDGVEAWLLKRFGAHVEHDVPAGALSLLADGGQPGNACWLRADPVHLRVNRDQLILADARVFSLSQLEAEAFTGALNRYFDADGLVFYPLRADRWYLRVDAVPAITTTSVRRAAGRHIDPFLPAGSDALRWHRVFNEIQMLFHSLPENEAREARGELPVNSVWLWGAGVLPAELPRRYGAVFSGDPVARGLALAAGASASQDAGRIDAILAGARAGGALVFDDALAAGLAYGDEADRSAHLTRMEREWFAPLLAALKSGALERLRIFAFRESGGTSFEVARAHLRRFWRHSRPLAAYA